MKWDAGDRSYELVEGWGELPDGWVWGEVAGVAVDSRDNVHVYTRTDHPYMVFDRSGKLIDHWGEGVLRQAHGIHITADDSVFLVSHTSNVVLAFDKAGLHLLTLGTLGRHSDTGFTEEMRSPPGLPAADSVPVRNGVGHSGPPFHLPTDVAVSADGEIFVSDGYRNARVHKFNGSGELITSWGEPGHAEELRDTADHPYSFHTPHGIWVAEAKVYVADLENNRVLIYDLDGLHLETWTGFSRPSKVIVDPIASTVYVSELNDRCSIVDPAGNIIGRIGETTDPDRRLIGRLGMRHDPGTLWGPHSIAIDSEQSLYIAEAFGGEQLLKLSRTR